MKKIIFFIFILFISNIFNSCSDELITIVDEYNPPYDVKVIPGNGTVSINFWSGILADDFVGFNLYAKQDDANFTNALVGSDGGYPTVRVDTHTRSNFTLSFSTYTSFQFTSGGNTLYYVAVTAFGTNSLAEGEKIETKVNAISVVPRQEQNGTPPNFTIGAGNTTVSATGLRAYGVKTNFNEITVYTNNTSTTVTAPYQVGGLYIFQSGNGLTKVWITSSGNYTYANHTVSGCNTI